MLAVDPDVANDYDGQEGLEKSRKLLAASKERLTSVYNRSRLLCRAVLASWLAPSRIIVCKMFSVPSWARIKLGT